MVRGPTKLIVRLTLYHAGLMCHEDLQQRIPRCEVTLLGAVVAEALVALSTSLNQTFESVVCGSYRRGKATSGDVDVLITNRAAADCGVLMTLVNRLKDAGFIKFQLSTPKPHVSLASVDGDLNQLKSQSFFAIVQLEGYLQRRMDFKARLGSAVFVFDCTLGKQKQS